jgi:Predicted site-specific integrase-resolvase
MVIDNVIEEKKISVTVGFADLKMIVKEIIEDTKRELEDLVTAQKSETYVSRQRACEMLDVDASTMWRWAKRNYLVPATVGGKKRYKMSDIKKLLTN